MILFPHTIQDAVIINLPSRSESLKKKKKTVEQSSGWWWGGENVIGKLLRGFSHECSFVCFFFLFSHVILQHAVWYFSSMEPRVKGKTRGRPNWGQNWGNDKWPTRIFPHGLTVRTEGPQVAGSPLHQPGAICSEAAVESQMPERWCWEVGGREKVRRGVQLMVGGLLTIAAGKGLKQPSMSQTWT